MTANEKISLSPDDILKDIDRKREKKQKIFNFLLVKDHGLDPYTEISIETRGGQKITTVNFTFKGLYTTFMITPNDIKLIRRQTVNDDNVNAVEDTIVTQQTAALLDYFTAHPQDRPE